jgi:alkylation response protein AidB-like acyl-CoA dehydrogenase
MSIPISARTPSGAALVALAERLSDELAVAAPEHDRDGSYPFGSIGALQAARYFTAPVPCDLGGLGVESLHDLVIAASRLARGDASVAIGVNMHMAVLSNIVLRWRRAAASGDLRRAAALSETLADVVHDGAVIAAAVSEPGQDLARPATTATRTQAGWRVDGTKIFCTMSPAATVLFTAVSFVDRDGDERFGYARIPARAPGVVIHDDWDALGMRASGSHSVTFDGVELPAPALRGGFPAGSEDGYMDANLNAGLFHAAASLGIAESAHEIATRPLADRELDARARMLVAESVIALGAARATLSRAATLAEEHMDADGPESLPAVFGEVQAAKTFINETAVRIVDWSLALAGGAAYRAGHPIARLYRDVRAGAFMHPLGANRAYEFLGQVSLGREAVLP